MYIVSVFLFAAAANLDSFVVGLSYGVRRVHIQFHATLLIAGIVMLGTFLSMVLGAGLKGLIPAEWGGRLGSGLILLLGAYCLVCFFARRGEGEAGPEVKLQYMGLRETAALGCALTVNNVGLGVGASIAGLGLWLTVLASSACSFLFLYAGNRLGKSWLSAVIGGYAEPISGVMMIALGLFELLG